MPPTIQAPRRSRELHLLPHRPRTYQLSSHPVSGGEDSIFVYRSDVHVADFKRSIDALRRYLTDRRPKLDGVLKTFGITPSQSHKVSPLSEATVEELREIPSMPLTALTPNQLIRFAQVVYTALFKSYLLTMPGLLGSLCRIENWCEVSEVEALLREREVRCDSP